MERKFFIVGEDGSIYAVTDADLAPHKTDNPEVVKFVENLVKQGVAHAVLTKDSVPKKLHPIVAIGSHHEGSHLFNLKAYRDPKK